MPGPAPKPASQRRRRNVVAGARQLKAVADVKRPALPAGRGWHKRTRAWWVDIWASPMAPEFTESDVHGLLVLAVLVDEFWVEPSKELAAEIRLQRQCFGLTPLDRRRLQWEIEKSEQAQESGKARRSRSVQPKADPRLRAV